MREEDLKRIFQPFQRLHRMEEYPGSGIGLALCQKIVRRHGGTIWVDSVPGNGSAFSFSIPVARTADRADQKETLFGRDGAATSSLVQGRPH